MSDGGHTRSFGANPCAQACPQRIGVNDVGSDDTCEARNLHGGKGDLAQGLCGARWMQLQAAFGTDDLSHADAHVPRPRCEWAISWTGKRAPKFSICQPGH